MIVVDSAGLLTTIQAGQRSAGRFGVAPAGPVDWWSAAAANRLVCNADDAPLLEITASGLELAFEQRAVVALLGATIEATIDDRPLGIGLSSVVPAGATVRFGERRLGARAYLAVAGGLLVPAAIGSASTDLRGRFGGVEGRAIRAGDSLAIGPADAAFRAGRRIDSLPFSSIVRYLGDSVVAGEWEVASGDRQGLRLRGTAVTGGAADLDSAGVVPGTIQVPPDGQPIVLLADAQPTGGYSVAGAVISADLPILAQLLPGDLFRLRRVGLTTALRALRERRAALRPDDPLAALW